MDLIDAYDRGIKEAEDLLKNNSLILNPLDGGNTPLHYAVAQHNLELIKWLIEQGACITAPNFRGETALEWFQLYLVSVYNVALSDLKVLRKAIEGNDSEFVAELLAMRLSRSLRFSQAKTLLHWAIEYQKMAVVNVLLEGIDSPGVERLLGLEDSRGVTPLAQAETQCQLGGPRAQEIMNYLQNKRCCRAEEDSASVFQRPWGQHSFEWMDVEQNELQALESIFSYHGRVSDIVKLNPLRSTIAKLAHNLCHQAYLCCTNPTPTAVMVPKCNERVGLPIEELFKKLFGTWGSRDQQNFRKKLNAVLQKLSGLIKQGQVEQVIEFSEERAHSGGWFSPNLNKIFLNYRMRSGVLALLATLIHELTHLTGCSYDFFHATYSNSSVGFSIFLKDAYRLAEKGTSTTLLMPEKKKLFEVRHLLEWGRKPKNSEASNQWKQKLYHWKARHSAETLTIAILAMATLSTGFARFDDSRSKPALLITPRFLSAIGVTIRSRLPAPESPLVCGSWGDKRSKVGAGASGRFEKVARIESGDSGISSGSGGSTNIRSPTSEPASPDSLTQAMAATQISETAGASLALSPEALQANKPSTSSSLASPEHQHLLKNCNQS